MLRASDDFGFSSAAEDAPPAADRQFGDILRDGAPVGIHAVTWCDTATNLNRTLDRTGLREFDYAPKYLRRSNKSLAKQAREMLAELSAMS